MPNGGEHAYQEVVHSGDTNTSSSQVLLWAADRESLTGLHFSFQQERTSCLFMRSLENRQHPPQWLESWGMAGRGHHTKTHTQHQDVTTVSQQQTPCSMSKRTFNNEHTSQQMISFIFQIRCHMHQCSKSDVCSPVIVHHCNDDGNAFYIFIRNVKHQRLVVRGV